MNQDKSQKNIPDGWKGLKVDEIFDFLRTYAISRENLLNGTPNGSGVGNVHYGDIHATYGSSSIDLTKISVPLVKDSKFSPKEEDLLMDGDLIMADVSEDYDGIGVTVSVHGLGNKKVVGGLHTFVLRDTQKKTDERYRQYIFHNPSIRKKLKKIANGVSVYGISKTNLSKLVLNIPLLPEQKRIVSVLEVWDQAIEKLSRKIEVKKNIKKGLMQNLLTGKVRLSGFSEAWVYRKIGEICDTSSGGTPKSTNEKYYKNGTIPWLNSGEVRQGRVVEFKNFITNKGLENSSAKLFPIKTVVVAMYGATAGQVGILEKESSTNQAICGVLPNGNICADFLYFLLSTKTNQLLTLSSGAAQPNISQEVVKDFDIFIPQSKEDQAAIAKILTTADEEIETLQKKLAVLKDQKKYLLNNLITGTIRTPETLSVSH